MTRTLLIAIALLSPAENGWSTGFSRSGPAKAGVPRHFILTTEHMLRPDEVATLAERGLEIQHVLPENRYIVRTAEADELEGDPVVRSLEAIAPSAKIARSALREAARARAFARVRLVFHDDVTFAQAQRAIERVGGLVEQPLAHDYVLPQRLHARIPFAAVSSLAADDSVFAVFGPPLQLKPLNAAAAAMSNVTPLFAPPYNLTGSGVVISLFELASPDTGHAEFGGRLINHIVGGGFADRSHSTHVAGTMIAAGLNVFAKGMASRATLHAFDVRPDYDIVLRNKEQQLPPLGVTADNNSWGFALGWQPTPGAASGQAWYGGDELFGAYEAFYSSPYDKITRTSPVLFIQSSGNEGQTGQPFLPAPNSPHGHIDENTGQLLSGQTFCYSVNGSGTDCPAPCSTGTSHCETAKHPTYGPFDTLGPTGSLKNVISVGAVDSSKNVASFSSRGPTDDGRIKPDLVAKGVAQLSTIPGGSYSLSNGTSMSAPVVTAISALVTEQWRRSYLNQNPPPVTLKTLLIAGADDLGTPGPDYTYGFGLVNAKGAVDLIIADRGTGSRVRVDSIGQGQQVEIPLTLFVPQNVRVVVGWTDPEVILRPDEFAAKTLVNDIDLRIIDPSGNAVLPYVLDKANPNAAATRGVNDTDNIEEVEIANAAPGTYRVVLIGTRVATGPTQQYALAANAVLGSLALACDDPLEPNDSEAAAFGFLLNNQPVSGVSCAADDLDFYRVRTSAAGPLNVTVTATDTPLRVTLSGSGINPVVRDIAAGTSGSVSTVTGSGEQVYIVRVEANGSLGATRRYTLVSTFVSPPAPRRRATRR